MWESWGPEIGWGQWHIGDSRYDARVGNALYLDEGQYHGKVPVEIRDKETGVIYQRTGDMKVVGNFTPIWVNFKGKKVLLHLLINPL